MSDLKYQLRRLLPTLTDESKRLNDPQARERLYLIKAVAKSPKPIEVICQSKGRSTKYFYSWAKKLLKTKSVLALVSLSRKPKRSPNQTQRRIEKRIKRLREAEPYHGPERISQDLKDLFNIKCAPSTVYSVLKRLGLISQEAQKKLTKKHLKRYRRPIPGYLQMDYKYVPYLINGRQYYQLSCVDHHSSWRLIRAYEYKSQQSVVEFLKELKEHCPFPIIEIQTDNDAAFTDKYRLGSNGHPIENLGRSVTDWL
jgi:transposase